MTDHYYPETHDGQLGCPRCEEREPITRELLEACEALLPHVIGHTELYCAGDCNLCKMREAARAAITKAITPAGGQSAGNEL